MMVRGAEVKAKVLEVDPQKQRLSLGLAPHHIADADASLLADGEAPGDADSASGSDLDDDLAAGLLKQTANGATPLVNSGVDDAAGHEDLEDGLDEGMVAVDSESDGEVDAGLMAELQREVLAEQVSRWSWLSVQLMQALASV